MVEGVDTIVIGGGTAGAAVAGLLVEQTAQSVLVLEAGPDYGPFDSGRWPRELLDARALGYIDAWGYHSGELIPGRVVDFERAKVIGGCSSHNGCAAIWGSRVDYDGWAARGNPGWSADEVLPLFREAARRLRVRRFASVEVTPMQQACLDAAPGIGIPLVDDINDFETDIGMSSNPVNIQDGIRWNAAFAYLDPVRERSNLTIRGQVTVDKLVVERGRVTGVEVIGPAGRERIRAARVVVAAGTYGSPAILLRSGIGDPDEVRAVGTEPIISLPGVGKNLHDHSAVYLKYAGTPELERRMSAFAVEHWMPEEQAIAKVRTARYPAGERGFDLHIYPVGGPDLEQRDAWRWWLPIGCMTPRSRGWLRLRSTDPFAPPLIDHRYVSDPEGADRAVLLDGIRIGRELAAQPSLHPLLGAEIAPGPELRTDAELMRFIDATHTHYYHPVGTCAMGPASDPAAVVDARGKIHGLDNAYVADCAIMPVVPRANTNIPAVVIGERIGRWLAET